MADKKKTFVLSDESVNSYGFRVLTAGIDLTDFARNPIMLWNHTRSWADTEDSILPIGRWENLRTQDGKLLGDAVFDTEDGFAAKIAGKVQRGVIKACSIGFQTLETSDAPEYLIKGQTRPSVTKCKLVEVSVTDIPANAHAVSLYDAKGHIIELTAETVDSVLNICARNCNLKYNNKTEKMKLIALALGLPDLATEAEIMAKVQQLLQLQEQLAEKEREITTLQAAAKEAQKNAIEKLVNDAIAAKKLTAGQKAHFVSIGETMGVEALVVTLSSLNGAVKPTDIIAGGGRTSAGSEKKWADLSAQERESLRNDDKERYITLFEEEYGYKPKVEE
jgi:HK97 family phage prohead protease